MERDEDRSPAAPGSAPARLLTISEAAAQLGISRSAYYRAAARGDVPAVRLGNSWRVPPASFRSYFAQIEAQADRALSMRLGAVAHSARNDGAAATLSTQLSVVAARTPALDAAPAADAPRRDRSCLQIVYLDDLPVGLRRAVREYIAANRRGDGREYVLADDARGVFDAHAAAQR
jgi:excisionase family DNA binding protein